ncbi:DNA polymerase III subunit beta [Pseudarthrobacter cellobiosi]|uniref:DNA polymerase III subunit beta n=1 Tax=Pseudarthrobacter cellobiosi TaxID=2953654 RepID=UPI00208ED3AE|nr:DNA polymerase III subunit beta [Pseudarthrobacter sp. HLT1-5]MCO4256493.1 DNA polymerase III subunit beta [Pseudarthrobacter sp. HLT1-5]
MTITALATTDTTITRPAPALADLEVTATSKEWLRKLRAVGVAASNRPPIPILACVLVECRQGKATVSAYDYETSAVAKLQHEPTGRLKDAQALLPISWLVRTIQTITRRNPKAPVTLAAREMLGQRLLTVSAEGYTIPILNHYNVAEYPPLPEHAAFERFRMDRQVLVGALNRSLVAASTDDTLPILTSIEIQGAGKHLTMQATDRYRLSSERIATKQPVPEFRFLMKAAVWKAISRHLDGDQVKVGVLASADSPGRSGGGTALSLISGDLTYTLMGTGGEYPKLAALFLDAAATHIEADRRDLIDQVSVTVDLNERNTPATIVMTSSTITIRPAIGEAPDAAVETPALVAAGSIPEDATQAVAFNPAYLIAALRSIDAEKVRLSFQESLAKPVCLTAGGVACGTKDTYRHLIMPVRLPQPLEGV